MLLLDSGAQVIVTIMLITARFLALAWAIGRLWTSIVTTSLTWPILMHEPHSDWTGTWTWRSHLHSW
jgi:hypothetical protein